jgi:alginate O-acetyltransferase complex protein AlgI
MLFNSFQFFTFYIVVVALVFSVPQRFRWILLLAASTYFYMCWNPPYIVFLIFVIVVDYFCGVGMGNTDNPAMRKLLLGVSLAGNIGLLFVFKYFNFFFPQCCEALRTPLPPATPGVANRHFVPRLPVARLHD